LDVVLRPPGNKSPLKTYLELLVKASYTDSCGSPAVLPPHDKKYSLQNLFKAGFGGSIFLSGGGPGPGNYFH